LNGERLVIPVLFGANDIDIGVNSGFRHGSAIRTGDLDEFCGIGGEDDDVAVAVAVAVAVRKEVGVRSAQDRRVRDRRTEGKEGAQ